MPTGVQEICRKLKDQLEELANQLNLENPLVTEEKRRRTQLMEQLKEQLAELSR